MANAIIKVKRGLAANLPTTGLNPGEFLLATDTGNLYICIDATTKVLLAKSVTLDNYLLKSNNLSDVSNVATARTNLSVYSKVEVDQLIAGLRWKDPVVAVATTNITLSAAQTIDGVSVVVGNRVLVVGQTDAKTNGIYLCATGAWTRALDADSADELLNAACFVSGGTAKGDTAWVCTTDSIALGTSNLAFVQFAGTSTYIGGFGVDINGNSIDLDLEELTAGTSFNTGDSLVFIDSSATGQAKMKLITKANFISTLGIVSDTYNVKANASDASPGPLDAKLALNTAKKGLNISGNATQVLIGLDLSLVDTVTTLDPTLDFLIASSAAGANEKISINDALKNATIEGGTF